MIQLIKKLCLIGIFIFLVIGGLTYISYRFKLDSLNLTLQKSKVRNLDEIDLNIDKFQEWYKNYQIENYPKIYVSKMSLGEKIGQILFVGINGKTFSSVNKDILNNFKVGGIYLDSNNISDLAITKKLNDDLQENSKIKLFISTDDDGGAIQKISWDKTNNLYGQYSGGVSYYFLERNNTEKFAYYYGQGKGQSLKDGGFNVNFSPITEGLVGSISYLKTQGWSRDFDKWIPLARQIILGQNESISSTMKYFPGTGTFKLDPNKSLQVSEMGLDELKNSDMKSFSQISNDVDFVMTSPVKYSQIDDNQITFSSKFINDILKKEIGYRNIVITSNLNAEIFKSDNDKYKKAIIAGHDMLFLTDPTQIQAAYEQLKSAIENKELSEEKLNQAVERVIRIKYKRELVN